MCNVKMDWRLWDGKPRSQGSGPPSSLAPIPGPPRSSWAQSCREGEKLLKALMCAACLAPPHCLAPSLQLHQVMKKAPGRFFCNQSLFVVQLHSERGLVGKSSPRTPRARAKTPGDFFPQPIPFIGAPKSPNLASSLATVAIPYLTCTCFQRVHVCIIATSKY